MARRARRIVIGPHVIECGDERIAVNKVSRAAIRRPPGRLRTAVIWLVLALVIAVATGAAALFNNFVLTVGGAGLALVLLIFALLSLRGRALVLTTADGHPSVLLSGDDDFMRDVLKIVTAGLVAPELGGAVYEINVSDQQILRRDTGQSQAALEAPAQFGGQQGADDPTSTLSDRQLRGVGSAALGVETAGGHDRNRLNGAAGLHDVRGLDSDGLGPDLQQGHRQNVGGAAANTKHAGGLGNEDRTGNERRGFDHNPNWREQPAQPKAMRPIESFDNLLERIAPQYGNRFDEVRLWLAPVREHLATGQGNREEAQARWSIFASEHLPALASISTVPQHAKTISRAVGVTSPI